MILLYQTLDKSGLGPYTIPMMVVNIASRIAGSGYAKRILGDLTVALLSKDEQGENKIKGGIMPTVQELQTRADELRKAIETAVKENKDFTKLAAEYASASAAATKEKVAQSSGAINKVKGELANQIGALVGNSELPKLIGEDVTAIGWAILTVTEEGKADRKELRLTVNPKRISRTASGTKSNGAGRKSNFKVTTPDGEFTDPKAYLEKYANEEEHKHSHYNKWASRLAREVVAVRLSHTVVS